MMYDIWFLVLYAYLQLHRYVQSLNKSFRCECMCECSTFIQSERGPCVTSWIYCMPHTKLFFIYIVHTIYYILYNGAVYTVIIKQKYPKCACTISMLSLANKIISMAVAVILVFTLICHKQIHMLPHTSSYII